MPPFKGHKKTFTHGTVEASVVEDPWSYTVTITLPHEADLDRVDVLVARIKTWLARKRGAEDNRGMGRC